MKAPPVPPLLPPLSSPRRARVHQWVGNECERERLGEMGLLTGQAKSCHHTDVAQNWAGFGGGGEGGGHFARFG